MIDRSARRRIPAVAALLLAPAVALAAPGPDLQPCTRGPDPFELRLVPTAHANGAAATVRLRFAESPFGVTVTPEGHHLYDAELRASGLPAHDGVLIAWAATPALDSIQKLGPVTPGEVLKARIAFNKFLVFVTAEPNADVPRWTGRILLRGISPSGRLHTMAGHGPFQAESCGGVFSPYGV